MSKIASNRFPEVCARIMMCPYLNPRRGLLEPLSLLLCLLLPRFGMADIQRISLHELDVAGRIFIGEVEPELAGAIG